MIRFLFGVVLFVAASADTTSDLDESCLDESCDPTTGGSLLQSKAGLSLLMNVVARNPRAAELISQASDALRSKVTPEVVTTIEKLIELIEADIENNIKEDHTETQKEIDRVIEALRGETTTAVDFHDKAKVADDAYIGCIEEEKTLLAELEQKKAVLQTKKNDADAHCSESGEAQHWSATVPEHLKTLTCDFSQGDCATQYATFKQNLKDWYDGLSATIATQNDAYKASHSTCEEKKEAQKTEEPVVEDGQKRYDNKRVMCQALDTRREVGMCVFGVKYQEKCKETAAYEKLMTDIATEKGGVYSDVDRKSEWASVQVMKCMLVKHKDGAEFDAGTMQGCQGQSNFDADVGVLDKKNDEFLTLTTAANFNCKEETVTFNGKKCTVPSSEKSADYSCNADYHPAISRELSTAPFDFCAVELSNCASFACPAGITKKSDDVLCYLTNGCTKWDCCDIVIEEQESPQSTACPEHSQGDNIATGCTCDAGTSGSIVGQETPPYYSGSCAPVACPEHTQGTNVVSGCTCVHGSGLVTATTAPPFYTSTCRPLQSGQCWCNAKGASSSGNNICGRAADYAGTYYSIKDNCGDVGAAFGISNVKCTADCATNYIRSSGQMSGSSMSCWNDSSRWARTGSSYGPVLVRCTNLEEAGRWCEDSSIRVCHNV